MPKYVLRRRIHYHAHHVAKNSGMEQDLIQEGWVAALQYAKRYPGKEVPHIRIRGAMLDYLRKEFGRYFNVYNVELKDYHLVYNDEELNIAYTEITKLPEDTLNWLIRRLEIDDGLAMAKENNITESSISQRFRRILKKLNYVPIADS
jgi:DNA-directed RNA polymerase specialized sigma subunit